MVYGGGERWVQSGWAPSEPPADQHRGGHEARVATSAHPREPESPPGVAPTSTFRLGVQLRRASPPYPEMNGGGERPRQSLASGSASRRKHSKGEAVLLASPLLGSREIRGDYPKTPLSKARLRGCRDGLRTGLGRGDTNLPLPGPRPNSPPSPGTTTSGSPLGPASPRARTTPHGVLSLRSESLRCLLPAQNGGGGHRAARRLPQGYGSLRAQAPPLPAGSSFLPGKD